jgi:translocation and assembly module TamB
MRRAAKGLRPLGAAVGLLLAVLAAVFGVLQTPAGQAWLARTVAQAVSDPDFTVAIEGLGGIVPFRMTVARIDIGDRDGTYLTLHDVGLDLSAAGLLAGRAHIRSLRVSEIDMARLTTAPSTTPFIDYLRVPHLPIEVVLDRLSIGRLVLAPAVLGESLVATVEGSAELAGETAHIAFDLDRTDGSAGNVLLAVQLAGAPPVLSLRLDATEPTGILLDRLLSRTDRAPLALSVKGAGPLADWHGQLSTSAGALARFDADVTLVVATEAVLEVSGSAALALLLPAELAPLVGDRVTLSLRATFGDRIAVDPLSIEIAAGTLTGNATFGGPERAVAAHLRASAPELSPLAGLLGTPFNGAATLIAAVAGTVSRPSFELNLSGTGIRIGYSGAERVEAHVSATSTGVLDNPETRIEFAANGRIGNLVTPEGVAVPRELGRDIDWSLAGSVARDGGTVYLTRLTAEGAGTSLAGSGQLTERRAIEGQLRVSIADLRPFSGLAGRALAGSIEIEANAAREGAAGFKAKLGGSAKGLRTGIAVADALLGGSATMAGSVQRDATDILVIDRFSITGAAANLSGDARFDPASSRLTAALALELPRLKPLGAALGTEMEGALSAHLDFEGPFDRPHLSSNIEGSGITVAGAKVDHLRLAATVPDLSEPKAALDGSFRAYGLDGTLALAAEPKGNSELLFPRLRLTAADSAAEGSLQIVLDTGLIRGSISGRAADLGRWSRLAGTPLAGSIDFVAGLETRDGQLLDLSLTGTRLAAGTGSSRIALGRVTLTSRFVDVSRTPSGSGRLSLTSASFRAAELATATLTLVSPRPGRFAFHGDAKGHPLTLALAGEVGFEPGQVDLRLTRLDGSLAGDRILLEQPLTLSKRGTDLAFSGLALDLGTGRIAGSGGMRGESLSLALNAANFPIASGARLLGYSKARGALTVATTIEGTVRAPQGRVSLNARELTLASSKHSQLTSLGVAVDGSWNGRNLDVKGQVTGLKGDTIGFSGSLPLLLTPAPLGISVPPEGRLALQLQGAGQLEHLADLLPLGEDRVSGRFAADVAVGGTIVSPAANGRLRLSDARYENFATGAVLTKMRADLVGDRDRFTLTSFSAEDNAGGSLKAQGNLILRGGAGPSAELLATLANFRVAARDEAVATASGTVSISGPLAEPKVTAPLTINRADINLPESLPPSVVVLKVVRTNSKTGKEPAPASASRAPALPANLDIKLDMPGNIFVRGHGLDSEWRGQLAIAGTSESPVITGSLEQIRGSVDLLGKTFTLTRSRITFDGSAKLDPVLDIVAEASAADITAQINIGGFASAPTITLSSTPAVPQDEILARVLFNRGVGQITAGEGLQLAAAAGTLVGGGPGVLDRLRGGLGLDWFRFGSGAASSTLNPRAASGGAAGGGAASGTALSAGKYIAPGVSVGVTQGLSPPTSKVTVEIELRPHLTVQGEAGQSGSTGIGLNYNFDY